MSKYAHDLISEVLRGASPTETLQRVSESSAVKGALSIRKRMRENHSTLYDFLKARGDLQDVASSLAGASEENDSARIRKRFNIPDKFKGAVFSLIKGA